MYFKNLEEQLAAEFPSSSTPVFSPDRKEQLGFSLVSAAVRARSGAVFSSIPTLFCARFLVPFVREFGLILGRICGDFSMVRGLIYLLFQSSLGEIPNSFFDEYLSRDC